MQKMPDNRSHSCTYTISKAISYLGIVLFLWAPLLYAAQNTEQTAATTSLKKARHLLMTGNYEEATVAYKSHLTKNPVPATSGLAHCYLVVGKITDAEKLLKDTIKKNEGNSQLLVELAELEFNRGRYNQALQYVNKALKIDPNHLGARWLSAQLNLQQGELRKANKTYEWFIDYYNRTDQFTTPEQLYRIGIASAQYARWNRVSDQFSFIINELYPEAIKLDKQYWPAEHESALLFLEKFNQAAAAKALQKATAINPRSPDVLATQARLKILSYELDEARRLVERALKINPQHILAHCMLADIHLANFVPEKAVEVLLKAEKLNPRLNATLGRLAATYGMVDGLDQIKDSRMEQLIKRVTTQNKHCGQFYFELGNALVKGRKYPSATIYYRQATEVMPQLVGPRGQLGLVYMNLGEESKAKKLLDESFKIDPFNVRVINSLKVLEVLDKYTTLETEHFIIRYDGEQDKILGPIAARYLESIYPELCERLDYQVPGKTLFEIFNKARNTDGHGWFSARIVGLPNIHTIGACAGKMVALTSPTSMRKRFNWARVLRHELVHVINLQQTNFNIPHWFTEGLAVYLEDLPRHTKWKELLAERVPNRNVFNLETINLGFIRPKSSNDWQMAYCQAEIYVQYMVDRYGKDSLGKMLRAYRDNLTTSQAVQQAFKVTIKEFESGYTEYLNKLTLKYMKSTDKKNTLKGIPKTFTALKKAVAAKPDDLELSAQLALSYLLRKDFPQAGDLAKKILAKNKKHPLATYVRAKLLLTIGEREAAISKLVAVHDPNKPEPRLIKLLAGLYYQDKKYDEATQLYLAGRNSEPNNLSWDKALAALYLKTGKKEKLTAILSKLATADFDNATFRKKLALIAVENKKYKIAERWANEAIQIDILDGVMHRTLGESLFHQKKYRRAALAYQTAIVLLANDPSLSLKLAQAYFHSNQLKKSSKLLEQIIKAHPNYTGALMLKEKIKKLNNHRASQAKSPYKLNKRRQNFSERPTTIQLTNR